MAVRFACKEGKSHPTKSLECEDIMMVTAYSDKRVTKVLIKDIPPEAEIRWLVSAAYHDLEKSINILEISLTDEHE